MGGFTSISQDRDLRRKALSKLSIVATPARHHWPVKYGSGVLCQAIPAKWGTKLERVGKGCRGGGHPIEID